MIVAACGQPWAHVGVGENKVTVTSTPSAEIVGGYRHEAFLYSGTPEFLSGTLSFIRRAVSAGDPVLVVVSAAKIGLLREQLGAEAGHVAFADMADVGGNPAHIIALWQAFVRDNAGAGQLCGIGEPIGPERSPAGLAECQLHEALLNVAFDAATPLWLLCPYDVEALAGDVIDEAHRAHPFVAHGDLRQASSAFEPIDPADPFDRPLPPPAPWAALMSFGSGDLRRLRAFVAGHAERAGLESEAAKGVVLAVSEIASNSIRHGGGRGELRVWADGRFLVCEVSDAGHITSPLVGRLRPAPDAAGGAGLWLANQLCDLVQISSSARGSTVRVHQAAGR
jgi:anti-sigma regulatory factor (Ser/Thr protein kinase)